MVYASVIGSYSREPDVRRQWSTAAESGRYSRWLDGTRRRDATGVADPSGERTVVVVEFFPLWVQPLLGRPSADVIGRKSPVAVLSHALWQALRRERNVIGRVPLNEQPAEIVGVCRGLPFRLSTSSRGAPRVETSVARHVRTLINVVGGSAEVTMGAAEPR